LPIRADNPRQSVNHSRINRLQASSNFAGQEKCILLGKFLPAVSIFHWYYLPKYALAGFAVLTRVAGCICVEVPHRGLFGEGKFARYACLEETMTEVGTRRERPEEQTASMTPSERTEGLARRQSEWIERSRAGGYYPSIFSVSPSEFFTMSPITLMRRFTEDIDRAFSTFGGNLGREGLSEHDANWIPAVEVRQSGNNLVIHADLPGLSENDVKIAATDDGLIIERERRREHASDENGWHRSERVYGRFYRLIPLPEGAKIDETKASLSNGVLEVTVPVPASERKRQQIPIGTSGQSLARGATAGR
jgi:HSP20 family protein